MIGVIERDKTGKIITTPKSEYNPSQEIKDLILAVQEDYRVGWNILNTRWRELNDESVLTRMSIDQKAFNTYVEPQSDDPDEDWRDNTVRPTARNKIISMAAHLTAKLLYPNIFAQNDQDEEDKLGALIMRSLIEWNIRNSNYEMSFLYAVNQGLVNPAMCIQVRYSKVLQTVRQKLEDGTINLVQAIDETLSGLLYHVVSLDEMLFTNAYGGYNIQLQRAIIRQRIIDLSEAQAVHGKNPNWKYVQRGIINVFNPEDNSFYQIQDEKNPLATHEVTYYNRFDDRELVFINGVLMSDKDQPMKHRRIGKDIKGNPVTIPVYPFAWSGFEPIDSGRFIYFKSLAFKMAEDYRLANKVWRMVLDGTYLQIIPPLVSFGGEELGTGIIFPGQHINFKNEKASISNPLQSANLTAGYNALATLENSISQSSQDQLRSGMPNQEDRTAFEVSRQEENARIVLGLSGKMIVHLVKQIGYLTVDSILQNQTIGEVEEITAGSIRMKFRSFLVPEQREDGRKITRKIEFTDELVGRTMTKEQKEERGFALLKKEGGLKADTRIIQANPNKFKDLKFMVSIDADNLIPMSKEFEKALKLRDYDRMILSPLVNREAVDRDFLFEEVAPGQSDKYMIEGGQMNPLMAMANQATGQQNQSVGPKVVA